MSLKETLTHFKEVLKTKNSNVLVYLENDVDADKRIIQIVEDVFSGSDKTDDLLELYSWHSGTAIDRESIPEIFYLFPGYHLVSIEEISELMSEYPDFKQRRMIPILSSGRGDELCFDLISGMVCGYEPWNFEIEPFTPVYDGLEAMIMTIICCFEKNYYFINPKDGWLDRSISDEARLSKKMNPISPYWDHLID